MVSCSWGAVTLRLPSSLGRRGYPAAWRSSAPPASRRGAQPPAWWGRSLTIADRRPTRRCRLATRAPEMWVTALRHLFVTENSNPRSHPDELTLWRHRECAGGLRRPDSRSALMSATVGSNQVCHHGLPSHRRSEAIAAAQRGAGRGCCRAAARAAAPHGTVNEEHRDSVDDFPEGPGTSPAPSDAALYLLWFSIVTVACCLLTWDARASRQLS
jgi:hypothetical protein